MSASEEEPVAAPLADAFEAHLEATSGLAWLRAVLAAHALAAVARTPAWFPWWTAEVYVRFQLGVFELLAPPEIRAAFIGALEDAAED